eukprot:g4115.t1
MPTAVRLLYDGVGLSAVVDATACGFVEPPRYFASVVTASRSCGVRTAIFEPSQFGFELLVMAERGSTPAALLAAAKAGWGIAWQGAMGRGCGGTSPQGAGWRQTDAASVEVEVDTSAARFAREPNYIVSLVLAGRARPVLGQHALFDSTQRGFRIFVRDGRPGVTLKAQAVTEAGWTLHWFGSTSEWSGRVHGPWYAAPDGAAASLINIRARAGTFTAPSFLLTLVQDELHAARQQRDWSVGTGSVFRASASGFSACVDADLRRQGLGSSWRVNYFGFDRPQDCKVSAWGACQSPLTADFTMHSRGRTNSYIKRLGLGVAFRYAASTAGVAPAAVATTATPTCKYCYECGHTQTIMPS